MSSGYYAGLIESKLRGSASLLRDEFNSGALKVIPQKYFIIDELFPDDIAQSAA